VALGLAYYNEGQFLECVMANREVVRLQPKNATAYCNTCAAFNSIKDWNHAIESCTEALKIDSTFQLAKNNLNWAKSQAALEKK
jgi:tetratricopeptide (TPR) repeat protein